MDFNANNRGMLFCLYKFRINSFVGGSVRKSSQMSESVQCLWSKQKRM